MKAGILLLARMGSTRLPGKMLLPVMGRPILEYQIERLRRTSCGESICLCTTPEPADDALVDLAARNGLAAFRGHAEDVVLRMVDGAREQGLDLIISIGGDDILADPDVADEVLAALKADGCDFAYCPEVPVGASPYGVRTDALIRLLAIKRGGTDGWERYFQESSVFSVSSLKARSSGLHRPELRMTLDYQEDFDFFRSVLEELYPSNPAFTLEDVIALEDRRPDILALGQARAEEWMRKHSGFDVAVG